MTTLLHNSAALFQPPIYPDKDTKKSEHMKSVYNYNLK